MSQPNIPFSPLSSIVRSELPAHMHQPQIRYAMVWEDIDLLYRGLAIERGEDILSISSAGDNVLNLLLCDPRSITAIDLNPAQNALLELKIAGLQLLSYENFLNLIGIRKDTCPVELYQKVRNDLSEEAKWFWEDHLDVLAKHPLYMQGRLEQYFSRWQQQVMEIMPSGKEMSAFLGLADKEAQAEAFERIWINDAFRSQFEQYFGAENLAKQGRDPAQFRYVDGVDVGAYFFERFRFVCTQLPIKGNHYLETFLTGENRFALPPYLREENFHLLQQRVERIRIVTEELETFLPKQAPNSFHKGNFSDLFEYVSEAHFERLLKLLHRCFYPGGRIAYWNLLVPRRSTVRLARKFRYLEDLSQQLWKHDRSWFYRDFVVEERLK